MNQIGAGDIGSSQARWSRRGGLSDDRHDRNDGPPRSVVAASRSARELRRRERWWRAVADSTIGTIQRLGRESRTVAPVPRASGDALSEARRCLVVDADERPPEFRSPAQRRHDGDHTTLQRPKRAGRSSLRQEISPLPNARPSRSACRDGALLDPPVDLVRVEAE